ncbi:DUF2478 domain-containing protein [Aquamicrobium defluvii]|nr:DUF2478 domain-containing protein [Aquamicrobium defluvii]TDR38031.1 uncharacterized protein DUF2478 [Aquamicrobium defluvii]
MARNPIAAITGAETAAIQALLLNAAARWRAAGLTVCGIVEESDGPTQSGCSCGILRNFVTGARFPMYLDEPPAHTSCHLDETGVTKAGESVLGQIAGADVVVLSKFGKVEAVGGGLFRAFEVAAVLGKPVITSVAPKHNYPWQRFAPHATAVGPRQDEIDSWWQSVARAASLHGKAASGR